MSRGRADIIYLRGVATSEERAARVTLTQLRANKIGGDLYRSPLFSSHGFQSSSELVDTDLNLYCIKEALALVVLVSFSGYVC